MGGNAADGRGRSFQLILAPEASFPSSLLFASRAATNSFFLVLSGNQLTADTDAHITETCQFQQRSSDKVLA